MFNSVLFGKGKVFVNLGETPISIDTPAVLLQASMKDATGQSYGVDIFVPSESAPGGEFAPGEQKRGEIGFQVPLDADEFVFIFDAAVFGAGKVFITVP